MLPEYSLIQSNFGFNNRFTMAVTEEVLQTLRTWHRLPAGELTTRLGVSRATLMRAIRSLGPQVVVRGRARKTAYAARRSLRGNFDPLSLYSVDVRGRVDEVGRLYPTYPQGAAIDYLRALEWPLDEDMQEGWFEGLPYPIEDMRPQGFLGRHFAHANATLLQVAEDPSAWSEDEVLYTLSVLGSDQPGNYILGEPALRTWLAHSQSLPLALREADIAQAYPTLAANAMAQGVGGSSAGGEFPKFTAVRDLAGQASHVLVKFSGSDQAPGTRRWADLLVCEHLAGDTVREKLGIDAAASSIYQFQGRTFLEVLRFDRHGALGRSPVCTWSALNAGLFGIAGRPWLAAADVLKERGFIDEETHGQIRTLWHFGQLIANADMHDGNLSFVPGLRLAPVYDMLPMLYAPERGVELPQRVFRPALPTPAERSSWTGALVAARVFWSRAAADRRITREFRAICAQNVQHLDGLAA